MLITCSFIDYTVSTPAHYENAQQQHMTLGPASLIFQPTAHATTSTIPRQWITNTLALSSTNQVSKVERLNSELVLLFAIQLNLFFKSPYSGDKKSFRNLLHSMHKKKSMIAVMIFTSPEYVMYKFWCGKMVMLSEMKHIHCMICTY